MLQKLSTCYPRFVQGAIYSTLDKTTLLTVPSGESYQIAVDPQELLHWLDKCDGYTSVEDLLAYAPDPEGYSAIFDILLEEKCLSVSDEENAPQQYKLIVTGDQAVLTFLEQHQLLAGFDQCVHVEQNDLAAQIQMASNAPLLVVSLKTVLDVEYFGILDNLCEKHQVPWVSFHLEHGKGWLGPLVVPGATSTYEDLLARRRCCADDDTTFLPQIAPPVGTSVYIPPTNDLLWMLGTFFHQIDTWMHDEHCLLLSTEVEADPLKWQLISHPILPLPDRQLHDELLSNWPQNDQALIDDRTGIIARTYRTSRHPTMPDELTILEAYIANMDLLETHTWRNFVQIFCSTFDGEEAALQALIGEAVERYCGNNTRALPMRKASYHELIAADEHAIDPEQLILYSDQQYADPAFPFERFTRDLSVWWVSGHSLTRGRPAWIPASLVYVNWYLGEFENEPITNYHQFPGMQAGPTLDFALASAIEEVVERDAMMIWWSNRQPLPAIQVSPELSALWHERPTDLGQRAWAIFLENEFDLPIIAGIVENTAEQFINFGFATRPEPITAIRKAWAEALGFQQGLRDMNLPDDQCIVRELLASRGDTLYPWRADRAYLDDCDPLFHDMLTLARQPQLFLDPRARERVRPWVDVSATRLLETLPHLPDRSVATYQQRIEQQGYEIFYADVTTPDVRMCGLHAVHVIIPGLVPNFPAAFPALGGGRLQQQAVKLGWRSVALEEDELNRFPLPFVY